MKIYKWRDRDEEKNRKKVNARDMCHTYLKRGKIKKVKCFVCGKKENLEFHHPNYDKPFAIMILCKKCHLELHRILKIITKKGGEENCRHWRT